MVLNWLKLMTLVLTPGIAAWLAFGRSLKRHLCLAEALFLILLAGVATVSWPALILAELGCFSLPLLSVLVVAASLCLVGWAVWKGRGLNAFRGLRLELASVALLGVIVIAVLLPSRPFEYILGGRDHGVYVNTGVNIAKTGSIIIQDSELAALPAESRRALVLPEASVEGAGVPGPWSEGQRLPGFTLRDLDRGIVLPHAFHLYPVWIAVFYAIGGLGFALWTTYFLGLLGIAALYFAARRQFGQTVGLLAASLLSINVAQMWFLRYPSAEIAVQFFFWAGLFAFSLMLTTRSRYAALLSAFAFGLIHLTKMDIVFVPVVLLLFFTCAWLRERFHPHYWLFVIFYALLSFQALFHAFFISTVYFVDHLVRVILPSFMSQALVRAAEGYPYPSDILSRLFSQNIREIALGALMLGALIFLLVRFKKTLNAKLALLDPYKQLGYAFLILSFALLALYDYFLLPRLRAGALPAPLVMLGWYVTPLGVLLGVVGFLQMLGEGHGKTRGFAWLMVLGNVLPLLIMGGGTAPDHFWAVRRFVPVAIPALFMFAGYLLWRLTPKRLQDWPRSILPLSLTVVVAITCWQNSRPLLRVVEYEGMIDQVSRFSADFSQQSVLLFEQSDAGNRMTAPLWLIFDRSVFMITQDAMSDPSLTAAIEAWQSEGREVCWVSTQGQSPCSPTGWTVDYLSTHVLAASLVENPVTRLPQNVGEYAITLDVHRVVASPDVLDKKTVLTLNLSLDQHGLYDLYKLPGLTGSRWTDGRVSLTVPVTGRPLEVILRMANGRPASAPVPKVSVYLDDTLLGTVKVEGAFQAYSLPVEVVETGDTINLRLEMETWNPQKAGYNPDTRDLGVLLDWVKIVVEE